MPRGVPPGRLSASRLNHDTEKWRVFPAAATAMHCYYLCTAPLAALARADRPCRGDQVLGTPPFAGRTNIIHRRGSAMSDRQVTRNGRGGRPVAFSRGIGK